MSFEIELMLTYLKLNGGVVEHLISGISTISYRIIQNKSTLAWYIGNGKMFQNRQNSSVNTSTMLTPIMQNKPQYEGDSSLHRKKKPPWISTVRVRWLSNYRSLLTFNSLWWSWGKWKPCLTHFWVGASDHC